MITSPVAAVAGGELRAMASISASIVHLQGSMPPSGAARTLVRIQQATGDLSEETDPTTTTEPSLGWNTEPGAGGEDAELAFAEDERPGAAGWGEIGDETVGGSFVEVTDDNTKGPQP